ncbi:hypothetical protein LEP1GSC125_2551 [Leptospira mayottensis 200901122]|uniref:Uncharacterized protein n=1 Tax=Leptospira mayottensis 200901122 TaxID=1193010 RepID=A0AA87SWR3_9LEPT|nr:hypothetical protein LEP1GSC125_2551 [Leptospira mayottensis 200901122]
MWVNVYDKHDVKETLNSILKPISKPIFDKYFRGRIVRT